MLANSPALQLASGYKLVYQVQFGTMKVLGKEHLRVVLVCRADRQRLHDRADMDTADDRPDSRRTIHTGDVIRA